MKSSVITLSDLQQTGRWRVELFIPDEDVNDFTSRWPLTAIGSLCEEVSISTDAPRGEHCFVYLGLENVESVTGDLVGSVSKVPGEIRSRCKTFAKGDVLYGRLRPILRKVFSSTTIETGLCSTEFIVLRPRKGTLSSVVLRALLASDRTSTKLAKMQSGAALPRVSSKDLLAIRVPVPDTETQRAIEASLQSLENRRRLAKSVLLGAVDEWEAAVQSALT